MPIRIELGPRDVKQGQAVAVRRDNLEKVTLKRDGINGSIKDLLEKIHESMFAKYVFYTGQL